MRLTVSLKLLCVCSIFLVHLTELVNSQLDFGDRPRIPPASGGNSSSPAAGGSSTRGGGSPPRGGGSSGSPPRGGSSGSPPRAGAGQASVPGGGQGSGGNSADGPPIIEAGGVENGEAEADGEAGGLLGLGRGRGTGRGRGLFGLGGRRGQQQPPPQQNQPPQIIPQSVCTLKADPGFCNLIIGRWYYDHRYHRCLPFLYTGCGGNINNFISIRQCEQATIQCHALGYSPAPLLHSGLTPGALNPLNPLAHLAPGYILGG